MGKSLFPASDPLGKEAGNQSVMPPFPHSLSRYDGGPGGGGQTQSDENEEIQEGMRKRWGERQLVGSQQGSNERRQAEEPKRQTAEG